MATPTARIGKPEARERAIAEVREIFDETVVWGEDLMELAVER